MVFSTFLIHLLAIYTYYSFIYSSQPISLILLTSRTSSTTLSVVMPVIGAAYRICVAGVVCVTKLAMSSITALTICIRSPAFTYCGGTPVGIIDGCSSNISCCNWGHFLFLVRPPAFPHYRGSPVQGFRWYY